MGWTRLPWQEAVLDEADGPSGERATRRPAPGKVTLTSGLPGRGVVQRKAATGTDEDDVAAFGALTTPVGGGAPLPEDVRTAMEDAFDFDFGAVRVHEDDVAGSMGAVALARGNDVHFAPGRYDPSS